MTFRTDTEEIPMNATAAQTAKFELQIFVTDSRAWVAVDDSRLHNEVSFATAQEVWRLHVCVSSLYVRLILVGDEWPDGSNVVFGSASADPIQDAADDVEPPRQGYWSADGRI